MVRSHHIWPNLTPGAALRLVNEIQPRLGSVLPIFPEAGPRAGDGRRFVTIRRHSVLYRNDAARDEGVILHVFAPGRDGR